MKRCPYCAEEIQDAAVFCKHCSSPLNKSRPVRRISKSVGVKIVCAATALVLIGVLCRVVFFSQPPPTRIVCKYLDAVIAQDKATAQSLAGGESWLTRHYVLSYSIKNVAKNTVAVEVMFRGDQNDNQIFRRDILYIGGHPKYGAVPQIVHFRVENGIITKIE